MGEGTYTLLLSLDAPVTLRVGALGERPFRAGWYAYTGSAFGAGGFKRVDRHRRLARADDGTRHWHLDYLLPAATVRDVFTAEGAAIECEVARGLPGDRIEGFGASDCDCDSHLVYAREEATLSERLASLYGGWPDRGP